MSKYIIVSIFIKSILYKKPIIIKIIIKVYIINSLKVNLYINNIIIIS